MDVSEIYDVVAVDLKTSKVRIIAAKKSLENAESCVTTAVLRRGVDEEFFASVTSGKYKEGDQYNGEL